MSLFRLERIIEIKEKLKEEKQREIDDAITAMNMIAHNIQSLEATIEQNYETLTSKCLTGNEFTVLKDYLVYLDLKRMELIISRQKATERVNHLRLEYTELAKEIKMLETLRSKAVKDLKKHENRKERKIFDDIALRNGERTL
jgi:flagellar export protein FliJ